MMVRLGESLFNTVSAYNATTHVATLGTSWPMAPATGTAYAFEYMLGTHQFPLHRRNCVGTGDPAMLPITSGDIAAKRRFLSTIYYVHDFDHPDRAGEVLPTLVRARLDGSGMSQAHQAPQPLIEGIEEFRVELGIDNVSDAGTPVDYSTAVDWLDPDEKTSPGNRGDGEPDLFIRCTTASPCTAADLVNVVAVKLYVLARSRDPSPGHIDDRTYCLGELQPGGACAAADQVGPANDAYKRHVFSTSVRLVNVSSRRETP
jgi:hypothetical protein